MPASTISILWFMILRLFSSLFSKMGSTSQCLLKVERWATCAWYSCTQTEWESKRRTRVSKPLRFVLINFANTANFHLSISQVGLSDTALEKRTRYEVEKGILDETAYRTANDGSRLLTLSSCVGKLSCFWTKYYLYPLDTVYHSK